jgi:hypothetical protein
MRIIQNKDFDQSLEEGESAYTIDRIMPIDIIFLLCRLINYSGAPRDIDIENILKLNLNPKSWESYKSILLNLVNETGIELDIVGEACILRMIYVSESSAKNIQRIIDTYLKRFIAGTLMPIEADVFPFEKQKTYFLKMIQTRIDEGATKIFLIHNHQIEKGYRLFESLLILEQQKFISIRNIYNKRIDEENCYSIAISINKKNFTLPKQETILSQVSCCQEGGQGYIKTHRGGKRIAIGSATAQPYRLVSYLAKPFGVARKIDTVFYSVAKNKNVGGDDYLKSNAQIRRIESINTELQKIPDFREKFKVHIDKQGKKVWLEIKGR